MLIELGNPRPQVCDLSGGAHLHTDLDTGGAPAVTMIEVPDSYTLTEEETDIRDVALVLARNQQLPDLEALRVLIDPRGGALEHHLHLDAPPSWVMSDNALIANLLSRYYECPTGRPDDLEDTHFTRFGPPGVGAWAPHLFQGNITQTGRDIVSRNLLGNTGGADSGTATATSATSLTDSGKAWTTNVFAGQIVWVPGGVYGLITSNTSTVLTVDRWYTATNAGGSAASTPGATTTYDISPLGPPAYFMGISTSATALGTPSTNTSLPSEITTSGGGLVRKQTTQAHTASAATTTQSATWTANGTDSLPAIVASMGTFTSMVVNATPTMLLNTLLSTTATMSASGDQLTLTDTISGT